MFAYTKLMQAMAAAGVVSATDPYFNLTTLLLNTSSTNGAQNNTFLDSSTNNFTITRNGNTTQGTFTPFSQTGWSNYFDGSSRLTFASDTSNVFGTGAFTVECWYYYTTSTTSGTAFITKGSGGTNWQFYVSGANGYLSWSNGSSAVNSSTTPVANSWNHFVYVRDGSNNSAMFLNGTRIYSGTDSTNYSGTGSVYIASDGSAYYFTGYLSNIRLVKGSAVYSPTSTTCTVPTSSLTAISGTAILTCQSNRFIDNSSIALAATITGTPSVQAFSPFAPTAAYDTAVVGGSGYFDGNDYLNTSSTLISTSATTFTIEGWIYMTATPVSGGNIPGLCGDMLGGSSTNYMSFGPLANGTLGFQWFNGSTNVTAAGNTVMSLNAWHHVAISINSSAIKMFVNGVDQTITGTSTLTNRGGTASQFTIGYNSTQAGITGYVSSLRVTSTAVYTATFTPPTAPLTAITNTQLLLLGTNSGIFDSTAKNVLETVGNAQVSTTQAKWGTTSMYFDGTGDALKAPYTPNMDFGTGDFTIECWVYVTNTSPGYSQTVLARHGSSGGTIWIVQILDGGTSRINLAGSVNCAGTTVAANTWTHLAFTRSGTSLRAFNNGVLITTVTDSTSLSGTQVLTVGAQSDIAAPLIGYLDDVRITKGYARYTATFTPPAAAFPLQ